MNQKKLSPSTTGVLALILSQLTFVVVIFYWKQVHVGALETLCNRMIWSWALALIFIILFDRKDKTWKQVLQNKKQLISYLAGGILLAVNWGTYLYCVNIGNIVETSLGYFINPLLICIAGIVIFKEKATAYNITAMLLGLAGVVYMTVNYGRAPVWALVLSVSYSLYSIIKRNYPTKPYISMFFETTAMLPFGLGYFCYILNDGTSAFLQFGSSDQPLWLLLAGFITLTPLMLYAVGLRTAPMMVVGLTSYISPTLSLLVGVLCYGEAFTMTHAVSFSLVWIGIIIFTIGNFKKSKKK